MNCLMPITLGENLINQEVWDVVDDGVICLGLI
jgi:hypothetical protein